MTPTDLLEAVGGELPDTENEGPDVVEREDGSLLMDGSMLAVEAFDRLQIEDRPDDADFHTLAGFALTRLGKIPVSGDYFTWGDRRFEVVDMDGRRIDKLLASKSGSSDLNRGP